MLEIIVRNAPFALATAALVGCTTTVQVGGSGGSGGSGAGGEGSSVTAAVTSTSGGSTSVSVSVGVGGSTPGTTGSGQPGFACSGPNSAGPSAACTPRDLGCNPGKPVCAAVEVVDGAPSFALKMAQVNSHPARGAGHGHRQERPPELDGAAAADLPCPELPPRVDPPVRSRRGDAHHRRGDRGAGQAPGFQLINGTAGEGMTAILPVTALLALGAGCDLDVSVGDVNVPLQYDANSPLSSIYLPFRHLRFKGARSLPITTASVSTTRLSSRRPTTARPRPRCPPTPTAPSWKR